MTADDTADDAAPADPPTTAQDETRKRFQEALERKRHRESHGDGPHGEGKSVSQHEIKRQRTFRRKSG